MNTAEEMKKSLQQRFTDIAYQSEESIEEECGCGHGCGCHSQASDMEYYDEPGYHPYADLGLGVGMPTKYAGINAGDTILDLGAGAGMDSFLARELTGPTGKVIGVDMTGRMVDKARQNAETAGYNNVEFRLGEIENLPASDKSAHVIIGNGIMNLVPDKSKAFGEIYRVMKHHGRLAMSEVMIRGNMPKGLQLDAEMYVGCMAGSLSLEQYQKLLEKAGFEEIRVVEEKKLELPDAMLHYYLPPEEAKEFREGEPGIYSMTLVAEKPCCHAGEEDHVCCGNH
jgi:ubiquinone/menaquinone biosynthesis C-methylase UbiE